ncbi:MAG: ribosome-associated translation inhibitor RaiA [Muribaculaceae bacterium]|nr:ribosome-associated translation inhibitor RaiA [Muribaculaceae bacterium]
MEVRVNAIHFDISEKLNGFIEKKAERLARRYPTITYIDVNLTLIKASSAMNKEARVKVILPHYGETVTTKTADTFEEAFDVALEAAEKQLEKKTSDN